MKKFLKIAITIKNIKVVNTQKLSLIKSQDNLIQITFYIQYDSTIV